MEPQDDTTMRGPLGVDMAMAGGWPAAMFVGVVTILVGVVILIWPGETLAVLSVVLGIQLLLFGLYRLILAFSSDAVAPGLMGLVGLVSMVIGVVVIRHPFETVAILATLLGVVWIVAGAIDLMGSMADSTLPDRGIAALAGAVSIVAGVVIVAWPSPTITVIAWVSGVFLLFFGAMVCATARKARSLSA